MTKTTVPASVSIKVIPQLQQETEVFCEIEPDGAAHQYVKGGVIKLKKQGQQYDLTFELEDGDVPGLEFTDPPFSSSASGCPSGGSNDGQFTNPQVKPNTNGRACTVTAVPGNHKNAVHYSLHFTDGSSCDPIIINGGTNLL